MSAILLKEMMQGYFDEVECGDSGYLDFSYDVPTIKLHDLPVAKMESTWEIIDSPRRLMKSFHINDPTLRKEFVNELLDYEDSVGHNAKITIDSSSIIVEVYTHDVNDVTEIDKEYAQAADDIHTDILHYDTKVIDDEQYFGA
tara:strand:- start:729 stop:1157 length:429 start_codon:yes stop_codon:yes gene_type:complete